MLPITEQENPATANIDQASTLDALQLINDEDKLVAEAVGKVLPSVAKAVEEIVNRLENGGRLLYIGTGTSGRLGVLDASEIPPTYGVSYDLVQGIIAGGYDALYKATEASEDNKEQGAEDLKSRGVTIKDAVIGIAASGRTPYTIGAVEYARSLGCLTACIVCNPDSELTRAVDVAIVPVVGPEAITGSTRMKAGTAQKLVLNMISTAAMIRLGYVKGNRMTNVKAANEKLKDRSLRILIAETGLEESKASSLLNEAKNDLRVALVMFGSGKDGETAYRLLESHDYVVEKALEANGTKSDGINAKLKTVVYLGGLVSFSIPTTWVEEYGDDGGAIFYEDTKDSGTLRLNVLTFASGDGSVAIDVGSEVEAKAKEHNGTAELLDKGNALVWYDKETRENGERLKIRYWEVYNPVPPKHLRIAIFSYTLLFDQFSIPSFQKELALLDREIADVRFAPRMGEIG